MVCSCALESVIRSKAAPGYGEFRIRHTRVKPNKACPPSLFRDRFQTLATSSGSSEMCHKLTSYVLATELSASS
jgi:hypothetical protein